MTVYYKVDDTQNRRQSLEKNTSLGEAISDEDVSEEIHRLCRGRDRKQ